MERVAIGWLITLRNNSGHPLEWKALLVVIGAYAAVSWIFYRVLSQYHDPLKKLLKLGDELAHEKAAESSLGSNESLLELFNRQPGIRALNDSLGYVRVAAVIVIAIMVTVRLIS